MSWLKQSNKALFEDLLWSKPENKLNAGKLLIVGGSLYSFNAPSEAYKVAQVEGAGTIRLLMPDSLKKTLGTIMPDCDFTPSNPSGSFSKRSLEPLLDNAAWADITLIIGDTGRNSETAILLESFLNKYKGNVVVTKDSLDQIIGSTDAYSKKQELTIVANLSQLQKICSALHSKQVFRYSSNNDEFAQTIEDFSKSVSFIIVTSHNNKLWCAVNGEVSSTDRDNSQDDLWMTSTAAKVAVWQMQNPDKKFQATTTALLQ